MCFNEMRGGNNMLKTCKCDDKKSDLEIMEKCVKKIFSEFNLDCVIDRFSDGKTFLDAHNNESFDVYMALLWQRSAK